MEDGLKRDLKLPFKHEKKVIESLVCDNSNNTMWKCWLEVIIPVAFCAKRFLYPGQPEKAQGYMNKLDVSMK